MAVAQCKQGAFEPSRQAVEPGCRIHEDSAQGAEIQAVGRSRRVGCQKVARELVAEGKWYAIKRAPVKQANEEDGYVDFRRTQVALDADPVGVRPVDDDKAIRIRKVENVDDG